ncbi:MAG: hypothetical protein KKD21_14960, partial [Proteobacteria bacterium]|nr:hypothetical protein [Pseudomonadota bacterium]
MGFLAGFLGDYRDSLHLIMKNAQFNVRDVKKVGENKLHIEFKSGKEFNGWFKLNGVKAKRITV